MFKTSKDYPDETKAGFEKFKKIFNLLEVQSMSSGVNFKNP
jgi:hypothetical protein